MAGMGMGGYDRNGRGSNGRSGLKGCEKSSNEANYVPLT